MTLIIKGDLAKQLVVDGTVIPTASETLRKKEVIGLNSLSPSLRRSWPRQTRSTYLQGMFKRDHFDEQAKKFLLLPPEQNRLLGQNIETEDLFKPYEYEPSASYTHVSLLL